MPRKRRRDLWGSITEVERNRRYRIRYWAETPNGYKRCSVSVRGTRKDAEKRRAELMIQHGDDAPCPTVGYVWKTYVLPSYMERLENNDLSPRSFTSYERSWATDVEPMWGDVPCDEVRPLVIQQWLTSLILSKAKRGLQLLTTTLDFAMRYEFVDRNAGREKYIMPSKTTVQRRDSGVWTLAELGPVWKAVRETAPWMEGAFIIAAFGGARVSESLGVYASEVSLTEADDVPIALVPIVRQMTKEDGLSDRLKTEQSKRTIAIPGRAAKRLVEIAEAQRAGYPLTNNGFGEWISRDKLNNTWRLKVLPTLPEDQRHPFQNLRNSWQTNCRWALDMPPWIVEPLMGHRGQGVTGQHYDRPQAEMFASVMAEAYRKNPFDKDWDFL